MADPEIGSYLGRLLRARRPPRRVEPVGGRPGQHAPRRRPDVHRARPHPHRALPLRVGAPAGRGRGAGRAHPRPPVPRDGLGVRRAGRGGDARPGRRLVPQPVPALGAARLGGGHRAGLQPAAPAGRRPRRRAPRRRGRPAGAAAVVPRRRARRLVGGGLRRPGPRRVAEAGLGRVLWASPFIGTVPGTDTYTDQLWSTPAR